MTSEPARAARPTVLLVDDVEDAREMYAEMLTLAGYRVATASDGEQAIAKALEGDFDLLILDLALPKVDGLTVIKTLRANQRTRAMPIVTLSAFTDPQTRRAVAEAGGDLALDKPCLPKELEEAVRAFVKP